ncbi:retropepsin-like aspartic protease [Klebsiella oxytoca]|uniref:retropepsin-like aspartic protease n=1 Tax=Klebsiella oxytoca TaxID=571 RepID=UPI0034D33C4B
MAINLPIYFMNDSGELSTTPQPKAVPVIAVTFAAADKDNHYHMPSPEKHQSVMVLIDTGATACYIDNNFADELELPVTREIQVQGGTSTINSTSRRAIMSLTLDGRLFSQEFHATPLVDNGRHFKAILGMEFLQHCTFTLDYQNNKFELLFNS